MSARVDTVIVSYNSKDTLLSCVQPLLATPDVSVIVVDNASPDDSLDVLEGLPVQAIQSGRNGGFGFGCNLGAAAGDAPYLLFLNPDARIQPADLRQLVAVLEAEPAVSLVAPRALDGTGALLPSQRRDMSVRTIWAQALFVHRLLPRARWANEVDRDPAAYARAGNPDWVSGACMLVRRQAFQSIGGFDERFFLYCEDKDLCRRLREAGGQIRFEPSAAVSHDCGQSAPGTSLLAVLAQSRKLYARKHSGPVAARLLALGLAVEAVTHLVANLARPARARGHAATLRGLLRRDRRGALRWS